jgi:hypothetical protein
MKWINQPHPEPSFPLAPRPHPWPRGLIPGPRSLIRDPRGLIRGPRGLIHGPILGPRGPRARFSCSHPLSHKLQLL